MRTTKTTEFTESKYLIMGDFKKSFCYSVFSVTSVVKI